MTVRLALESPALTECAACPRRAGGDQSAEPFSCPSWTRLARTGERGHAQDAGLPRMMAWRRSRCSTNRKAAIALSAWRHGDGALAIASAAAWISWASGWDGWRPTICRSISIYSAAAVPCATCFDCRSRQQAQPSTAGLSISKLRRYSGGDATSHRYCRIATVTCHQRSPDSAATEALDRSTSSSAPLWETAANRPSLPAK